MRGHRRPRPPQQVRLSGDVPRLPVTIVKPDPDAWERALELADGDPHRCSVQPDGSVIVRNA